MVNIIKTGVFYVDSSLLSIFFTDSTYTQRTVGWQFKLLIITGGETINNLINEQIRAKEVRLIDENGAQVGIVGINEALEKAREAELDLVLIAPMASPPVCKIIDFGKFRYEQARKEKEAKKKQKVIEIKEVRLSPNIDLNDIKTKANMARKFIEKGDKVKITLRFRGREMAHMQDSKHVLDDFAAMLEDIAVIEKPAKVEGRNMVMFLVQKKS